MKQFLYCNATFPGSPLSVTPLRSPNVAEKENKRPWQTVLPSSSTALTATVVSSTKGLPTFE